MLWSQHQLQNAFMMSDLGAIAPGMPMWKQSLTPLSYLLCTFVLCPAECGWSSLAILWNVKAERSPCRIINICRVLAGWIVPCTQVKCAVTWSWSAEHQHARRLHCDGSASCSVWTSHIGSRNFSLLLEWFWKKDWSICSRSDARGRCISTCNFRAKSHCPNFMKDCRFSGSRSQHMTASGKKAAGHSSGQYRSKNTGTFRPKSDVLGK